MRKSADPSRVVADAKVHPVPIAESLGLPAEDVMCECGDPACQERTRIAAEDYTFLLEESVPLLAAAHAPSEQTLQEQEIDKLRGTVHQLQRALDSRVAIEQAKGVLAERHRIAPDDAFELLRRAARSNRRKVAEVAQDVILSSSRRR